MSASPLVPTINLNPSMGAVSVGVLCAAIFQGITTMQTLFYYTTYPRDPAFLKALVAVLWILDALSLAMLSYTLYIYLVLDFMNPSALETFNWGMTTEPILANIIACAVHLFLTHRIWMLNKRLAPLAIILVIISLVTTGFGFVGVYDVVGASRSSSNANWVPRAWVPTTILSLTTALDLVITFTMCLELYKSRTGFKRSDKMITLLTAYTISSGMLPALMSIGSLVSELVAPQTLATEAFNAVISKAYINGLLATLNSRQSVASQTGGFEHHLPDSQLISTVQFRAAGTTTHGNSTGSTPFELSDKKATEPVLINGPQDYSPSDQGV
ncbi:hypothetical protein SCP_0903780 [Sparassis crispa]|uniref:DUF6534 domain-containing protein n=1 Tax=Sparassis crispa TaxID=139825 RepID=A0A401GWF1_9APHY|nr:hypothetical protein SCP_0903780 [Sparassis crispa]GBE86499.1 hypothetical protein SCP_0903780 [Sparassis crispa]